MKSLEVRNTFRLLEVRRVVCVLRASTGMLLVHIPVLSQGAAGRLGQRSRIKAVRYRRCCGYDHGCAARKHTNHGYRGKRHL